MVILFEIQMNVFTAAVCLKYGHIISDTNECLNNCCLHEIYGHIISDTNECLNNPCLHDGICFNTDGSYRCQCTQFWEGQDCQKGRKSVPEINAP